MHLRNNFVDLADISHRAGDDFTVVARFSKPYFLALRALATLQIYRRTCWRPLETCSQPHPPRAGGDGSIPVREWKTGDRISFVRNERYWGRKAHLDRIVYRFVPDPAVGFQLLKQGSSICTCSSSRSNGSAISRWRG